MGFGIVKYWKTRKIDYLPIHSPTLLQESSEAALSVRAYLGSDVLFVLLIQKVDLDNDVGPEGSESFASLLAASQDQPASDDEYII